jgi:5-methylcytosine-specific restriction endonuclease McrA
VSLVFICDLKTSERHSPLTSCSNIYARFYRSTCASRCLHGMLVPQGDKSEGNSTMSMRPGGEKRGNSTDRRRRKFWMLVTWGDGVKCPCVHCGAILTYETVEADRIVPGGSYARSNVQPACRGCNLARSNKVEWSPALVLVG